MFIFTSAYNVSYVAYVPVILSRKVRILSGVIIIDRSVLARAGQIMEQTKTTYCITTYNDESNEIDPIPEGMCVLYEVHNVYPTRQADHLSKQHTRYLLLT